MSNFEEAVAFQIKEQAEYNGLFTTKLIDLEMHLNQWEIKIVDSITDINNFKSYIESYKTEYKDSVDKFNDYISQMDIYEQKLQVELTQNKLLKGECESLNKLSEDTMEKSHIMLAHVNNLKDIVKSKLNEIEAINKQLEINYNKYKNKYQVLFICQLISFIIALLIVLIVKY